MAFSHAATKARSDGADCLAVAALDRIGERWTPLVLRELMLGPRRFGDLRKDLPGLSANVLTQRLESLRERGLVVHRTLPAPANVAVYELTEEGRAAEPVLLALMRWGHRVAAAPAARETLSVASLLLGLRALFSADRADGFKKRIGLATGERAFLARVKKGRLLLEERDSHGADCVLSGTPACLAAVLFDGRDAASLVASGQLRLEGDPAVAERFARLFDRPAPVDERGSGA